MRITPLAVYLSEVKDLYALYEAVKGETNLTHKSGIVVATNYLYIFAIHHLLYNANDAEGAVSETRKIAEVAISEMDMDF